jgi:hypothetical protein
MSGSRGILRLVACLLAGSALCGAAQAPSDATRAELRGLIENVTGAAARRFGAVDSAGNKMDTAKIIPDPTGGYLAVYHTNPGPRVSVATSTDLVSWTFRAQLGTQASQPTIAALTDDGFLVVWEQEPSNHLAFRYYRSHADLLRGVSSRSFDAPQTLSPCAEGTPNIYSVTLAPTIDASTIDVGAHYFSNCDVDRQQRGTLKNFSSWTTSKQQGLDNAILHWGIHGNIGDRDAITFRGLQFDIIEGQFTKGDFGSWRSFLFDFQTGNADQLAIRTPGGSTAFANPSFTRVTAPGGRDALLVTLFLPSEGAAPGEAGELIYYNIIGNSSVVFFQDVNFGGQASLPLAKGSYTLSQLQAMGIPNDWASSVRIPPGTSVTLFQDDNFSGASWTLTSDTPDFRSLKPNANDEMSSCRIQ